MSCPLCQQRQPRRQCPALGRAICPVCCGTKRLVEIGCPPTCGYLASAHAHPAATVRRQQERDYVLLMAMREGLSSAQADLLWAVLTFVAGFRSDPLMKLQDEDLAEGAASLASTYETAGRGVIYEHRPQSLAAQRLVTDMKAFLTGLVAESGAAAARTLERDATAVLRALERGIKESRKGGAAPPAGVLDAIGRVVTAAARQDAGGAGEPRIEPPGPMLVRP